ncbi:MAG: transcription antitermination factor NusB [Alphaproteobacteria bacterium]|nr:transcription antitermination factor NusB [Alphaproteobacteria bacterium]
MKRRFNRHQRSTARLGVVQMLFVHQNGETDMKTDELLRFFDTTWEKPDMHFLQTRINSACKNIISIDEHITSGLQSGWTMERIDPVLYAILAAATDEMMDPSKETPSEILVKEYADLAADFFDTSETAFVNAYLNDLKVKLNFQSQEKE